MKNIFCAFLILASLQFSYGQIEDFRLGVQISPTFSWMNTDNNLINSNGLNTGIQLGLVGEVILSEHFSFNIGMGLSFNKGGTLRHDIGGNLLPKSELSDHQFNTGSKPLPDDVDIKYSLQYLEIPVSLKMSTKEFGYIKYFVEAPIVNWGLRTQARGDVDGISMIKLENEDISNDVVNFYLAWGLGAGIEYSISLNNSLIFGLYYNSSLTDITKNFGSTATTTDDNGTPNDYTDDIVKVESENSRAKVSGLSLRIGILF